MKEYDLKKFLGNYKILDEKIDEFLKKGILKIQKVDKEEIEGHILKSEHNLRFIAENIKLKI